METAHHSIVEPLLGLLTSLYPDVQSEGNQGNGSDTFGRCVSHWACLAAVRLIFDLRRYDVKPVLLSGLVTLLRPTKEEQHTFNNLEGDSFVFKKLICKNYRFFKNHNILACYKSA